jgi:GT2 family glycosyltransferase
VGEAAEPRPGMTETLGLSIVIPTYQRESVLIDTLEHIRCLSEPVDEILVIDQTEAHESVTADRLGTLSVAGAIRWVQLQRPSITAAMNRGLLEARADVIVFLDDDIRPDVALLAAHRLAHAQRSKILVAGKVIQPWEEDASWRDRKHSKLSADEPARVDEFMGGNFSIRRQLALELGGFDENFVHVAYRFEAEFAHRFRAAGGHIYFEPRACLHHLREPSGGTRSYGEHLTTARPSHAVGDYYFALRTRTAGGRVGRFLARPVRAIATRHHLRRPWWIPVTLCAEARGMWWALRLQRQGPRLIGTTTNVS